MKKIISINAKAFVIPNSACALKSFIGDSKKKYFDVFATLNNTEIKDDDKMIQLWLHNTEELQCDNLARHSFEITLDDGRKIVISAYDLEYFPAKLLENIKEGESVKYQSPYLRRVREVTDESIDDVDDLEIILDITMTCQQKGYRYQRFGNFEDVVSEIIK